MVPLSFLSAAGFGLTGRTLGTTHMTTAGGHLSRLWGSNRLRRRRKRRMKKDGGRRETIGWSS